MKNGELIEIQTDGYCAICGEDDKIHNHHLSYGPIVGEEVEITLPVCSSCHKTIHLKTNELKCYCPEHIPSDRQMRTLRESRRKEKHPEENHRYRKSRDVINAQMRDWRTRNHDDYLKYQRGRYADGGKERSRISC